MWNSALAILTTTQISGPRYEQETPGYERLSFEWTRVQYDVPNEPWIRLRKDAERISTSGKGEAFRSDLERKFSKLKPTTQQAFQYAIVAINDRLARGGRLGLVSDLAPARMYVNRAPLVRAPEVARLQIILNALIEQRPDVVQKYSAIARRFAAEYSSDRNLRYYASMLLTMSGAESDQLWAIAEANRLLIRWPDSFEAGHAGMHSTFVRWTNTHRKAEHQQALTAARMYERILLNAKRDPSHPRSVLKVLLKARY